MNEPANLPPDPTLQIAERQLAMLAELAELGMAAARESSASAIASAKAEQTILAQEWFTPEVGRARACGARDGAESFQKISRAVRLTLTLEMKVAEIVRDIRAGVVTHIGGAAPAKRAGETPSAQDTLQDRRRLAGSCPTDRDPRSSDSNNERLFEFERPDTFSSAPFRDAVEGICLDIGAKIDWDTITVAARNYTALSVQEPDRTPTRGSERLEPALPP